MTDTTIVIIVVALGLSFTLSGILTSLKKIETLLRDIASDVHSIHSECDTISVTLLNHPLDK